MKRFILLTFILAFAWVPGRDILPQQVVDSPVGVFFDSVVGRVGKDLKKIYNLVRSRDYNEEIITVDANQISNLLKEHSNRKKVMLVLIYDLNCYMCRDIFDTVNTETEKYSGNLITLAVSTDSNRAALAKFMDGIGNINFKPLILASGKDEKSKLGRKLRRAKLKYRENPYVGVISVNDSVLEIIGGNGMKKRIKAKLRHIME